jgi:hypothetical protein
MRLDDDLVARRCEEEMNKGWILFHLHEAHEDLTRTIAKMDAAPDIDGIEFEIAIAHIYNHLNTAWNSRDVNDERIAAQSEEDFFSWRAYPTDISIGR